MLNIVPHIFSSMNVCARTLVFFIIEENRGLYRSNAGQREMHPCRDHAIRQLHHFCQIVFFTYIYSVKII